MKSFHAFLIILALTVVIGSIATHRNAPLPTPLATQIPTEVLSETDENVNPISAPSPQASAQPSPQATLLPEEPSDTITQNSPMLIFPGAKIVSQNNSQTVLEVTANPSDIANWYRQELNELGMRALASSQNNVNGNFQAKISAAEGNRKYDIEIIRKAGENNATIILK